MAGAALLAIGESSAAAYVDADRLGGRLTSLMKGAGLQDGIDKVKELGNTLAGLTGGDDDEVATGIGSSIVSGRLQSLREYGIVLDENAKKAIADATATSAQAGAQETLTQVLKAGGAAAETLKAGMSESSQAAGEFSVRMGNVQEQIGQGAAEAKSQILGGILSPLLAVVEKSPELQKTAGWIAEIGGSALTAGGSILGLTAQVGQSILGFQAYITAKRLKATAETEDTVATTTNAGAQVASAEATGAAGVSATVATRGFNGLTIAEEGAAAAGASVASAASGPQAAGAAAVVAAREFDALTAAEERAAIAGRGVGAGAAGAAASGGAAAAGAAGVAGAGGIVGTATAAGAAATASAAPLAAAVGAFDALKIVKSFFTDSDKDLEKEGNSSAILNNPILTLGGLLKQGTAARFLRSAVGLGRPDEDKKEPDAAKTPTTAPAVATPVTPATPAATDAAKAPDAPKPQTPAVRAPRMPKPPTGARAVKKASGDKVKWALANGAYLYDGGFAMPEGFDADFTQDEQDAIMDALEGKGKKRDNVKWALDNGAFLNDGGFSMPDGKDADFSQDEQDKITSALEKKAGGRAPENDTKARDANLRAMRGGGFGSPSGFLPNGLQNGDGFRPAAIPTASNFYPMDGKGMSPNGGDVRLPLNVDASLNAAGKLILELNSEISLASIGLRAQRGRRPR